MAADFSQELQEVLQTVKRTTQDEPAIELTEVDISYYRPGLIARWRGVPEPPATVSDVTLTVKRGEVTSALDVSVQVAVLDLPADLQRERNTTYIFIAHDLAVVRAIAERVVVLYQGRLCEVGPVDKIYSPPYYPYTETLLGAVLMPDPDTKPKLLASDTPELAPPGQGCAFQRRCPHRIGDICNQETPPWQSPEGAAGHKICCHIPIAELLANQALVIST